MGQRMNVQLNAKHFLWFKLLNHAKTQWQLSKYLLIGQA